MKVGLPLNLALTLALTLPLTKGTDHDLPRYRHRPVISCLGKAMALLPEL